MSDYIFGKIQLGDFVVFRYDSPVKKGLMVNPIRDIMVLTPNFQGKLHGIKIAGLAPTQQEYLQNLLRVAHATPNNIFEPMQAQINQRKKELDILNQQRNEMLKAGQRVIVTPTPQGGMFDVAKDKAKQVLGSVIGKITTFGRTPAQTTQANQMNPQIQVQIQKNDMLIKQKQEELNFYMSYLGNQKQLIGSLPQVPTDPYHFYHQFFKMFIGNPQMMKQIYRKFDVNRIKNPRIMKSVGLMPDATRR